MADRRAHRGAHPEDAELFNEASAQRLRAAAADLAWLLSRSYALPSALKLVGDRHNLAARQRTAVMRATCCDTARASRSARQLSPAAVAEQPIAIDGYNVLTTVEAALAGGVILACRDGSYRDMASMHGTWRRVEETVPAMRLVLQALAELKPAACRWLLDRPVSNSGRLRALLLASRPADGTWEVELCLNPDVPLAEGQEIAATADSVILDRCRQWFPLARYCVQRYVPQAWVVELTDESRRPSSGSS